MRTSTVLFWLLEEPGPERALREFGWNCVQPYNGGSKLKTVRDLPCNSRDERPSTNDEIRSDIDRRVPYFQT